MKSEQEDKLITTLCIIFEAIKFIWCFKNWQSILRNYLNKFKPANTICLLLAKQKFSRCYGRKNVEENIHSAFVINNVRKHIK